MQAVAICDFRSHLVKVGKDKLVSEHKECERLDVNILIARGNKQTFSQCVVAPAKPNELRTRQENENVLVLNGRGHAMGQHTLQ